MRALRNKRGSKTESATASLRCYSSSVMNPSAARSVLVSQQDHLLIWKVILMTGSVFLLDEMLFTCCYED